MTHPLAERITELPDDACDCAIHVYEPGFSVAPTATFIPRVAPLDSYLLETGLLGLSRVVIAQPSAYGFDNSCTLQAIARRGGRARGLAVVAPGTSAREIDALHHQGMRGVRYMLFPGGVLPADALEDIAAAVAPFGWHLNLRLPLRQLPSLHERLKTLVTPLVIDLDLGCHQASDPIESAAFGTLRALVESGSTWLKIASPYAIWLGRESAERDGRDIQDVFVRDYPDRCIWASNWPHPNVVPMPAIKTQADWAVDRIPTRFRQQIFVDNPARLYDF